MLSWEWMREIEGKEEVLVWHFIIKSEDLLLFFGEDMGRRKKGRGPCKSDSYKILNLAFYSVTNSESRIKYNLHPAKRCFAKIATVYFPTLAIAACAAASLAIGTRNGEQDT